MNKDFGDETTSEAPAEEPITRALRLLVFGANEDTIASYPLPDAGRVVIGRGEGADLRINDASISRLHAALSVRANVLELEDLGSSNGTVVGGKRLARKERVRVMPGEAFDVGAVMLIVQRSASRDLPRRLWTYADFDARVEEECERARRSGNAFLMLSVKTDDKRAERTVREALSLLRPFDFVASDRPGEYRILVVDAKPDQAAELVDSIKRRVESSEVEIGSAVYPTDGKRARDLISKLERHHSREISQVSPRIEIVVRDPVMIGLYRLVERVAPSDLSVLILGETGAGKEAIAEAVHTKSSRCEQPFVRLNCAALSESLLESELFGHEKGAFTGALATKQGLLETAQGGTVLLDEIGELPLSTQIKLLRVLEQREVLRVGAVRPIPINVRFIAATNRNVEEEIKRGAFRSDLYYRLNGVTLVVPPLRERTAEIEALALAFAERARRRAGFSKNGGMSEGARALLRGYYWPGNVRELRNVIERAVLFASGGAIDIEHLPVEQMRAAFLPPVSAVVVPAAAVTDASALGAPSVNAEHQKIVEVLDQCGGNQTRAAKMLGISRGTLLARIDTYGIARPRKN